LLKSLNREILDSRDFISLEIKSFGVTVQPYNSTIFNNIFKEVLVYFPTTTNSELG